MLIPFVLDLLKDLRFQGPTFVTFVTKCNGEPFPVTQFNSTAYFLCVLFVYKTAAT